MTPADNKGVYRGRCWYLHHDRTHRDGGGVQHHEQRQTATRGFERTEESPSRLRSCNNCLPPAVASSCADISQCTSSLINLSARKLRRLHDLGKLPVSRSRGKSGRGSHFTDCGIPPPRCSPMPAATRAICKLGSGTRRPRCPITMRNRRIKSVASWVS